MVLDTKPGIIHWEDCPSRMESDYCYTRVDYDPPNEEEEEDETDEDDEDEDDEGETDEDEGLRCKEKGTDNHSDDHEDEDKRDAATRK